MTSILLDRPRTNSSIFANISSASLDIISWEGSLAALIFCTKIPSNATNDYEEQASLGARNNDKNILSLQRFLVVKSYVRTYYMPAWVLRLEYENLE